MSYLLQIDDAVGDYPTAQNQGEAIFKALDEVRQGHTVTIVIVNTVRGDELHFSPLCTITPPVVPTFSTSPEVSA